MPRGKELEQLPMANIAPGAGKDVGPFEREVLGSIVSKERPKPSEIEKENEDMI
ncbi:malate dehydrogenase [Bacillus sp. FJAT-29814]|uniref:malate dehydrogenase n=1 Tax=Bacillus sp. FJAT-29814 TaxID=1729688 RepID=UPI0008339F4B|nr:malate dehydrogenase [Bacillus sp. FJAT-29814]